MRELLANDELCSRSPAPSTGDPRDFDEIISDDEEEQEMETYGDDEVDDEHEESADARSSILSYGNP